MATPERPTCTQCGGPHLTNEVLHSIGQCLANLRNEIERLKAEIKRLETERIEVEKKSLATLLDRTEKERNRALSDAAFTACVELQSGPRDVYERVYTAILAQKSGVESSSTPRDPMIP